MDFGPLLCGDDPSCSPFIATAQIFVAALLGILFTQSGLDKVLDWKGNIGWITEHFAETPFRNVVKPMVASLTLFELATGVCCLVGAALLLFFRIPTVAIIGVVLAGVTMLQLFAGQRIAKDYGGAAEIAPYFLIMLVGLALFAGGEVV